MTTSFFGTAGRNSAPVDETMVVSSMVTPGRVAASDPVAMTIDAASTSWVVPSSAVTRTRPGRTMVPRPWNVSILFFLNRKATPLTLAATVSSRCLAIAAQSSRGGSVTMPSAAKPWAAVSNISVA